VLLSVQTPYDLETGWVPVLHVSCNMVIGFVIHSLLKRVKFIFDMHCSIWGDYCMVPVRVSSFDQVLTEL
jgi:hypothetical protein